MHTHHHHHEAHNLGAGGGPVMVDVGAGAGALILHAGADQVGLEIEISPAGQDERRSHVAVLARPLGRQTVFAAVYPTLAAGVWHLWDPASDTVALTVSIREDEVAEAYWPQPDRGMPDRSRLDLLEAS